jgi:ankyrin repeat protein
MRRWAAACGFWLSLGAAACLGPHPSTPLGAAAWEGRTIDARRLIAGGTPADTVDGSWTPLMYAARRGHLATMRALLDAGADANHVDSANHWTPLMHALHTKQHEAAMLLLARGADPAIGGHGNGFGPLAMAALDNDTSMESALIAKGVPRDQTARALEIAVSGGTLTDIDRPLLGACYTESVSLLLQANPAMQVPGGSGTFSPLWWARMKRCREVVRLVEQRRASAG